jgi:hypothetical protein
MADLGGELIEVPADHVPGLLVPPASQDQLQLQGQPQRPQPPVRFANHRISPALSNGVLA